MADAILTVVSHHLLTLSSPFMALFANITARYADVISTHDAVFSSRFMRHAVIFRHYVDYCTCATSTTFCFRSWAEHSTNIFSIFIKLATNFCEWLNTKIVWSKYPNQIHSYRVIKITLHQNAQCSPCLASD
jgi:hypothetical protein